MVIKTKKLLPDIRESPPMKKLLSGALIGFCLVSLSSFSQADFATENNLVLNGIAVHTELRQPVFLAKLSVTHPASTPNEARIPGAPAQMELTLLKRSWSSRQFRQYWLSGIAINAGLEEMTAHQTELLDLATVLKGRMRENDRFSIDFIPGEATIVSLNDVELKQYRLSCGHYWYRIGWAHESTKITARTFCHYLATPTSC